MQYSFSLKNGESLTIVSKNDAVNSGSSYMRSRYAIMASIAVVSLSFLYAGISISARSRRLTRRNVLREKRVLTRGARVSFLCVFLLNDESRTCRCSAASLTCFSSARLKYLVSRTAWVASWKSRRTAPGSSTLRSTCTGSIARERKVMRHSYQSGVLRRFFFSQKYLSNRVHSGSRSSGATLPGSSRLSKFATPEIPHMQNKFACSTSKRSILQTATLKSSAEASRGRSSSILSPFIR
eukprot:Amastigsp_a510637_132.p3 type:complete len:239 gc:universal Amastigsp_a510637_132:899-183(-)